MVAARSRRGDRGGSIGGGGGGGRGSRGGSSGGRIGSMGRGGSFSSRPQPSTMRSVVGSYTVPQAPMSGFTQGARY